MRHASFAAARYCAAITTVAAGLAVAAGTTSAAATASMLAITGGGLTGGAIAPPELGPVATTAPPRASLRATFTERTPLSRTPHCAPEPKICQAVLKGTGHVVGFGAATEITGVTQDRGVTPCGPGSDSEVYTRRIETRDGVLALRASGVKCRMHAGLRITARYAIDGNASTGEFAGARGHGSDSVVLRCGHPGIVTIVGTLKLT